MPTEVVVEEVNPATPTAAILIINEPKNVDSISCPHLNDTINGSNKCEITPKSSKIVRNHSTNSKKKYFLLCGSSHTSDNNHMVRSNKNTETSVSNNDNKKTSCNLM